MTLRRAFRLAGCCVLYHKFRVSGCGARGVAGKAQVRSAYFFSLCYAFGASLKRRERKSDSTPAQRRQERRSDPISTRRFFAKRAKRARDIPQAAKKKGREIVCRTLQLLPELPRVFAGQLVSTSANPSFRSRSARFVVACQHCKEGWDSKTMAGICMVQLRFMKHAIFSV